MLIPFGNRVIVRIPAAKVTEGGVFLPDTYKQSDPDLAIVEAMCPETQHKDQFGIGSKIVVVRSLASKTEDSGDKFCIVDVDDILAIEACD